MSVRLGIILLASAVPFVVCKAHSDSILDMINTEQVERLIAERKANFSNDGVRSIDQNYLEDDDDMEDYGDKFLPAENMVKKNISDDGFDITGYRGDKLLKSSKSALLVTKKEYLKKDWCKTEPLIQIIKEEGCTPVTIYNRFCYGQCNSFYIPKNPKRKGNIVKADYEMSAFKSCAFCKPKRSSWITVTLRCRKSRKVQIRRKKILRIKQCKCLTEILN